ncbi:MAG TPA: FtsX-like permease family protein [Acidimicrobiia bacterium]|nr:FtsX-like permease family protein [Acidimicrobiia bacterium]
MSTVLHRKLSRDVWRQRTQFAAVVVVVAIGIAVFVAANDAYRNLKDSFSSAYVTQRLPDVVLSGPGVNAVASDATRLPGAPFVTARAQQDSGARIAEHTLLARVISLPDGRQPDVGKIALRQGRLPSAGEVLVEQHVADHFKLKPGSTIELYGARGWQPVVVSGSGLATEYFWPARSQQEMMTSAEQFGVVFAPEASAARLMSAPERQLALYTRDRRRAPALVAAATALAREHGLVVQARKDQPSFVALDQDVQTFGQFANLLPLLFLVAAVLGAFILLSRLVSAQRAVIGTLVANGISPRTLRRHYLGYGLIAGIAAAMPGLVLGVLLGRWLTTMYTGALGLPLHVASLHIATMAVAVVSGVAATAFAAWGPARAAARTAPAEAMRVAPAGHGSRSLLERVAPPVRHLPARWRMVVRGLGRNRRRAVFTVVGVAVSLSLVLVFAGLRDTVANVLDRQYGTVDRSDGQLYATSGKTAEVVAGARRDPAVAAAEPFARVEATLTHNAKRFDTILVGLPSDTTMHRFVEPGGRQVTLPPSGVLLGRGLGNLLSIRTGDQVTVTAADGARLVERVAGFVDEPLTAVAYTSLDHLNSTVGRDMDSGALIKLRPDVAHDAVTHRLGQLPGAAAYFDNAALEQTMRDAFQIMDVLVGVMLLFAIVMAVALLYNAMSANLAERSVELGTLTAAGMSRGILGRLVATENLLLTAIGIPIGIVAGIGIARWFMSHYENLGYRWELRMQPSTVLLVVLAVFAASLVAQWSTWRGLKRINVATIVRERSL